MADALLSTPDCPRCEHLADALITADRRARLAEQAIRDMQEHYGEDPNASYVVALLARIEILNGNVERLTARGRKAA